MLDQHPFFIEFLLLSLLDWIGGWAGNRVLECTGDTTCFAPTAGVWLLLFVFGCRLWSCEGRLLFHRSTNLLLVEHLVTVVRQRLSGISNVKRWSMTGGTDGPHLLGSWFNTLLLEILQVLVRGRVAVVSAVATLLSIREVTHLNISATLPSASGRTRLNRIIVCEFAIICGIRILKPGCAGIVKFGPLSRNIWLTID